MSSNFFFFFWVLSQRAFESKTTSVGVIFYFFCINVIISLNIITLYVFSLNVHLHPAILSSLVPHLARRLLWASCLPPLPPQTSAHPTLLVARVCRCQHWHGGNNHCRALAGSLLSRGGGPLYEPFSAGKSLSQIFLFVTPHFNFAHASPFPLPISALAWAVQAASRHGTAHARRRRR